MTAALTAALSSPQFLYRSEIGVPIRDAVSAGITTGTPNKLAQADQSAYVLTPYEYASALAYSLTGTPDDTLLAAAKAGTLTTDAQIQAQVTRLLDTNRGKAQVGRFAGIWFNTDSVMNETRDATAYPKFTTSVQRAMAQEVREVFKISSTTAVPALASCMTPITPSPTKNWRIITASAAPQAAAL